MDDDILIEAQGVAKKFCRSLKRSLLYGVQDTLRDLSGRPGLDKLRPGILGLHRTFLSSFGGESASA